MKIKNKQTTGTNGVQGPQGPAGAQGPAGPQGAAGAPGAAGTPAPKMLNGNGDPGVGLSGTTVINDYYLDNVSGNLWQRQAYTGSVGPTTLILAGNVQWEKVSLLKGAVGTPAPKMLNGNGEPGVGLSGTTVINDYYLDNVSGNLWQRHTYTGSVGPTTLILAGNVQWEKVALLKGPVGATGAEGNMIYYRNFNPVGGDTATTKIGDFILVGATGDIYQRELDDTLEAGDGTNIILFAGNVRWRKKTNIKGPAGIAGDDGQDGQNQIPVLDLFVSQTGSDTNSGLTDALPLLTLTKAAEIAVTLRPELLKIHFLEPTVTSTNIRVDAGTYHFPFFDCNLSLLFPFEGNVTVGTYVQEGVTRPVNILCTKNVFIGGDEGENSAILSLTMPIIDTSAYDGTQLDTFHTGNTFVKLVPDDYSPAYCRIFTEALSIKKNVFLFKSIAQYGNHRPCHFQFIPYNPISTGLAVNVEATAGIVENFTTVKTFWVPPTARLSTVSRPVLHCDSNAILRGNMVSYVLRELRSEEDVYVEYGVTHGYFFWPARQVTPEYDDEVLIAEVTDYHIYETPDLDYTTHAPQLQVWGNEHGKIWISAHRLVNNLAITVYELTLKII